MAEYDVDAARAEARLEPHIFKIGGRAIEFPPVFPIEAAIAASRGDLDAIGRAFLGDEGWAEFKALGPSSQEFDDAIGRFYGGNGLGESQASGASSKKTGKRSRPTSTASTA